MDYEKKYKEAVCNIQKLLENGRKEGEVICAYEADFMSIFPELKESEDEKIRKGLIEYFKDFRLGTFAYLEPKKIIAWLEKQGKQIPANSAKTCKDEKKPYGKREECYDCQMNYGGTCKGSCAMKRGEQKPADKVEHKRMTKLEDKLSSLVVNAVHIYCKENELDTPHYVGLILGDRLAKEWSQDILTLAKDELKMTEQKPAEWDNNDEYIFNTILHTLDLKKCKFEKEGNSEEAERWHTYYNWMKPLKNRILPQPKQEWSEDDKRNLNWVINVWNRLRRGGDAQTTPSQMEYLENFLKSLKERYTWKPSDEQIGALEHFVRSIAESGFASPYDSNTKLVYSLLNDLKKLKL